jgi:triacylglycerol lipase
MEKFQPHAVGFSLPNAYALSQAAGLSYQTLEDITKQGWSWGFPQFKFLDCDTTQAFVMGNQESIVIAFRGTEMRNLEDWKTDLKANLSTERHGLNAKSKVHEGFQEAIEHIWENLVVTILKFRTQKQKLFLTGHSMGGALATLAALRLTKAGQGVDGIYTYGSPRVGDRDFRSAFNEALADRAFRFVNDEDIVTRLPMKVLGYCHVGQKCRFDAEGNLERTMPRQLSLLDYAKEKLEECLDPDLEFVKDHDLRAYQSLLLESLTRSLQKV